MELPRNTFKAALAAGQRQVGLWNTIPDPGVTEMLAGCGYDWLVLDTEHVPIDAERLMPALQACAPYPVHACVRPGWNDAVEIKKLMDLGAQTLIVPYVQSAAEAEAAVAACRYPPEGMRGVAGAVRASGWGAIPDYVARANAEVCTIVQVETKAALDALDAILGVEGVDGVFVGPADLSTSLGYAGDASHPEVQKVILDTIRRIRAAGRAPGILGQDDAFLARAEEAGALFIAVGVDGLLLRRAALDRRAAWG